MAKQKRQLNWLIRSSKQIANLTVPQESRIALFLWPIFWGSQICLIALNWKNLPPQIPLYYSRPWGENQLTVKMNLFLLPLLSLAVLLTNTIFAKFLSGKNRLITNYLIIFASIFAFLNLGALYQIIIITTR